MEDLHKEYEQAIAKVKQEWDALTPAQQEYEHQDYQFQVVSSHHDAFDHPFHAIFARW